MIVYSFFLNIDPDEDLKKYSFLRDYGHCLKSSYKGFHPVIKNSDGTVQILYAMTTSKKLRDMFTMTRDMNIFTCFKSEMSDSKYSVMKKNFEMLLLTEKKLIDVDKVTKEKILVPVVLSLYEFENVEDDLFHVLSLESLLCGSEFDKTLITLGVLSNKLTRLLNKIKYQECIDLISFASHDSEMEYYTNDFYTSMNSFYNKSIIKTLEIFIHLYGNTLKR